MKLTQDLKGLASELIYPFVKLEKINVCENCYEWHRLTIWDKCRNCYIDALIEMEQTYRTTSHLIRDHESLEDARKLHHPIKWQELTRDLAGPFINYQDNQLRRIEEDITSLFT